MTLTDEWSASMWTRRRTADWIVEIDRDRDQLVERSGHAVKRAVREATSHGVTSGREICTVSTTAETGVRLALRLAIH